MALKIVYLEDDEVELERVREQLRGVEANFEAVQAEEDFRRALDFPRLDLILANHDCKSYDSLAALTLAREKRPEVPVVLISGRMGDSHVIDALVAGATDFVFKQHLPQLVPVVQRIVRELKSRGELKSARTLVDSQSELLDRANDGIILCDSEGTISYWNQGAQRLYGWKKDEAIGRNVDALLKTKYPEGSPDVESQLKRASYWEGQLEQERRDGTIIFVASAWTRQTAASHRLQINKDITTRRRAEDALRESEERYRSFVVQDFTGNFIMEPNGKIRTCNPAFLGIFGFKSVEEAQASNFLALFRSRKDGAGLLDQLRERRTIERDDLQLRHSGGGEVYVVARFVGTFGKNGELTELQGYIFNDTKRKRLEQQLIQAHKMEGLGTLAGGIAHDFNNILAIILGYTSRLEGPRTTPDEVFSSIKVIKDAVERGAALVQQLLTSARQTEARFSSVDLNGLVEELQKMLQATFPKMITFELRLEPNLPMVTADRSQIHQVLLNLCINARDAMAGGGTLAVQTCVVPGTKVSESFTGAHAAQYVCLQVCDTGTGISREVKSHIFEPFFTTKERGKGTGLGLSVVYGVINNHHGFVQVESEPGNGTTFIIYLPIERITKEKRDGLSPPFERKEVEAQMILLVEDEEMLRDLGVTILQNEGYRVLPAKDGEEAVELFQAHRNEIGLVVCDLGLPRLGGHDAFLRMKKSKPSVRAIVASGYLEPSVRSQLLKAGVLDTIQKPYDFRELVGKIRSVIGAPKSEDDHPQLF